MAQPQTEATATQNSPSRAQLCDRRTSKSANITDSAPDSPLLCSWRLAERTLAYSTPAANQIVSRYFVKLPRQHRLPPRSRYHCRPKYQTFFAEVELPSPRRPLPTAPPIQETGAKERSEARTPQTKSSHDTFSYEYRFETIIQTRPSTNKTQCFPDVTLKP